MPLLLDITQQLVNVHWEKAGKHFLYSGGDGMFGSEDGQTWKKAPASVAAKSLAWIDGVWIAAGEAQCWRSEDGAKTWTSMSSPAFQQVAAATIKSGEEDENGVFAGWLQDEDGNNQLVYTSHDLGKTWAPAHTIPMTVGVNGYETVNGLSGAGNGFFVCTIRGETRTHDGNGWIHISTDGSSFSAAQVFGEGTDVGDDATQFPRTAFSAGAVAYDKKTDTYTATALKRHSPASGTTFSSLNYIESSSPSIGGGGEGAVAASAEHHSAGGGDVLSPVSSAAGGDGRVAAGYLLVHFPAAGGLSGDTKALFILGSADTLESMGTPPNGFLGSFCFNDFAEEATDGTTTDNPEPGMFACVSFGNEGSGGVYVARAGAAFAKTHSGTGISLPFGNWGGAVAAGNVAFLETSETED